MDIFLHRLNSTGKVWYLDWLYGGVDFGIDGNGGEECAKYLSIWTRSTETVFFMLFTVFEVMWACQKLTFEGHPPEVEDTTEDDGSSRSAFHLSSDKAPVTLDCVVHSVKNVDASKTNRETESRRAALGMTLADADSDPEGAAKMTLCSAVSLEYLVVLRDPWPWMKRALLVLLCMVFGIEIGYKFATKSIIYLLNPCHMLTFTQIYLLASDHQKKCKTLNTVFRVHLYLLNGALLAMIFYVVNTRFLPFEQAIYWIQHMLLYIIPIYLISLGGSYSPDEVPNIRWPILSIGICALYHFGCLQGLATLTQTNLNNMLCPAVSDPFKGEHYRKWATLHQHIMIPLHGKLYVFLARLISKILAAVQSFCVAVTLKVWRWSIRLCLASARVYIRVRSGKATDNQVLVPQDNACSFQKPKMS